MNLRPHRREDPAIEITPLIDIVFLMLIFFMISTTFIDEADLQINLPEASTAPAPQSKSLIEVVISAEGQYTVDGRTLINRQPETLRAALEKALADEQRPLVIRADAKTPHQAVVTALDMAGQAGVGQVSIATVPNAAK